MRAPPRISRTVTVVRKRPNSRLRPKHHEFIRRLPCLACGRAAPSECAHVRTGTDGGIGLKPASRFTLPLCTECHRRQHSTGELTFWADLGIDPLDYALRLWTVTGDEAAGLRVVLRAHQAIALHHRG